MNLNTPTLPGGLIATALEVAIHKPGQNPDHGEGVTRIALEDQGAGFFLVFDQPVPHDTRDGIALDPKELEAANIMARALLAQPGANDDDDQPNEAPAEPKPSAAPALAPNLATEAADTLRRLIGLLDAATEQLTAHVEADTAGAPATVALALSQDLIQLKEAADQAIKQARHISQRLQATAIGAAATLGPFDVPPLNHTAHRKLSELIADGFSVCGVMISRAEEDGSVKRGAVSAGGMVVWWNPANVPAIDYRELIKAAYEKDRKWAAGTNGCVAFKAGAEWFRDQAIGSAS